MDEVRIEIANERLIATAADGKRTEYGNFLWLLNGKVIALGENRDFYAAELEKRGSGPDPEMSRWVLERPLDRERLDSPATRAMILYAVVAASASTSPWRRPKLTLIVNGYEELPDPQRLGFELNIDGIGRETTINGVAARKARRTYYRLALGLPSVALFIVFGRYARTVASDLLVLAALTALILLGAWLDARASRARNQIDH